MARPTKQTHALPVVLEALRTGATRTAACAAAGVTPPTLQRWARNETTQNALAQAEAAAEVFMVGIIRRAAEAGSWKAATWWLERRRPDDWGRRDHVAIDLRQHVEAMAAELGLDAGEVMQEAERLISLSKRRALQ